MWSATKLHIRTPFIPYNVDDIHMPFQSNIFSFADDTTLCLSNADLPTLYLNANAEINKLYHWFCSNKLMLNVTKIKYIIIKPNQRKCNVVNLSLEIGGTQLMRIGNDCTENATKFLGLKY